MKVCLVSDKWKEIWNHKSVFESNGDLQERLIRANGFDGGPGSYETFDYLRMVEGLIQLLQVTEKSKVLEIGCGSGALLFAIANLSGAEIYGYDFSETLIKDARRYIKGNFEISEAIKCPFENISFDFAISHSVFQYFPNKEYAFKVITLMSSLIKYGGKIAIYDLNDSEKESQYHEERRLAYTDPRIYDNKYRELQHLFFNKNEIHEILLRLGFHNIVYPNQSSLSYKNSKFRFNVCATKYL
jgi:ubiquinone/menaquinone biosynthesis C-methylase UbiE